jgi:purine-binding chemotaxis protein CheW
MTFLICRSGPRAFAVGLRHVLETMRPLPLDTLPDMPPFVSGTSLVRGTPVPVVDAAKLFGDSGVAAGRLVVLELADRRRVALAVEQVVGVREIEPDALFDAPALLREASAERVLAMGLLDGGLLMVLQTALLVPQAVWQSLETREALQ